MHALTIVLGGEDFMNELDLRIQALTPEDMLDGGEYEDEERPQS